jgi:hypothetical protein
MTILLSYKLSDENKETIGIPGLPTAVSMAFTP